MNVFDSELRDSYLGYSGVLSKDIKKINEQFLVQ